MTDFVLSCLLSMYLLIGAKYTRIIIRASVVCLCLFLSLLALGWSVISRAFLESLSAINQTIGGVIFGAVVLSVVGVLERKKYAESEGMQRVVRFLGTAVLAALMVWFVFFLFKASVGVPLEVYREAREQPSPALLPALAADRVELPAGWAAKSPYRVNVVPAVQSRLVFLSAGFDFPYSDRQRRLQRDFRVGDYMGFNAPFGNTGPNSVEVSQATARTYLVTDVANVKIQRAVIAEFRKEIRNHAFSEPKTIVAGESKLISAMLLDGGQLHELTQLDFDELRLIPIKFAIVIAQITYTDKGVTHHLRRCEWPSHSTLGSIWFECDGFNRSD
jgi:hypothetical protein